MNMFFLIWPFITFGISFISFNFIVQYPIILSTNMISYPPFNEKFSIIYPTHKKRIHTLSKIIQSIAYGQSKYIDSIFIYWIDRNISLPPPKISEYVNESKVKVYIEIINSEKRLLTDRFIKPKNIKTRTVFSSDDDVAMKPEMLDSLFEMYLVNNFRNYILGALTRYCYKGVYGGKNGYFNMVLTDSCFLDVSMLDLYQSPKYIAARNWVNERFNGEDIMMNYIVQENYKTPPLAVKFTKGSGPGALSSRPQHWGQRTEACKFFNKFFGYEIPREHATKNIFQTINNSLYTIYKPDYY